MHITQGIYAIPPVWQALSCLAGLTLYSLILYDCRRKNREIRRACLLGAALSLCLIAVLTLVRREAGAATVSLRPFRLLMEAQERPELYRSVVLNIALFLPFGMTLSGAIGDQPPSAIRIALTGIAGAAVSCLVEFLQYRLGLGRTEIDDVICNTIGAVFGALPFVFAKALAEKESSGTERTERGNAQNEGAAESRNEWIDLLKYVSALLIAAIHCNLFRDVSGTLYFAVVNVLCRFAVPFFAMCTGYFLAKWEKKTDDSAASNRLLFRQEKKLVLLYAVWTIVYLLWSIPKWVRTGWFSAHAFLDYAVCAATKGAYVHLWYLLSLILALPLFWLCLKKCKPKQMLALAICLYAVKTIRYAYYIFLPPQAGEALALSDRFPALFDAVFCILPLLLLGAYCSMESRRLSVRRMIIVAVSMLIFLISEKQMLVVLGRSSITYLFFALPLANYVFRAVLTINRPIKNRTLVRTLGTASLFIYCVHPMFAELFAASPTYLRFTLTAVISTLLGLLYASLRGLIAKRKLPQQ